MVAVFVAACSRAVPPDAVVHRGHGPEDFDYEAINAFVSGGTAGVLSAFKGDPDHRSSRLQLAFYLDQPGRLKADYMIGNYTGETLHYLVYVLIDYTQREFLAAGASSKVHRFSLQPRERQIVPLEIARVEAGAHDLLVLAIRAGHQPPDAAGDSYAVLAHRANVFVGGSSFPLVQYRTFPEIPNAESLHTVALSVGASDGTHDTGHARYGDHDIGKPYHLHVANPHDQPLRYASILFAPTSRERDAPEVDEVVYHAQGARTVSAVPVGNTPLRPRRPSWAVTIENPYAVLEPRRESMAEIPTAVRLASMLASAHATQKGK